MTLKERLLEAGIYEGFIRHLEADYTRMHGSGIQQDKYR